MNKGTVKWFNNQKGLHELHEQGNTVVLITHDNDIARQAKRSIHILDGRVTEVQL